MGSKNYKTMIVFLIVLMAMVQVFGQETETAQKKRGRMGHMNLTEEQIEQIHKLNTEVEAEITPIQSKLKIKKAELEELMIADNPSQKTINKKIDEISALETQIKKKRTAGRLQTRSLMTDEQKVWFDKKGLGRRGMRGHRDRHFSRARQGRSGRQSMRHRYRGHHRQRMKEDVAEKVAE
jgi:Spy/CpxP family protein refolding chaperone